MLTRKKTQELMARARHALAGGVSSAVRLGEKPFPMCYSHAQGSKIYDCDGNEYIDYALGQGPLVLGHSPKPVLDAVQAQLRKGIIYAAQNEAEIELAELLQKTVPCAELVRFNNTGSEAVHAALRLARAYTGKNKIIRFEGHYHGWFDNLLISNAPSLNKAGPREAPTPVLGSRGQTESSLQDVVVLPWNDLALVEQAVAAHRDHVAGIITEPIMLNSGGILPIDGFLQGLRDLCTRNGIVLIFDEVITGFRLSLGGAQAYYGVTPDLATFAKGIASGFPLSAIVGKAQIMDLITRGEVMHAGTYNSNPVVAAAGLATVKELARNGGALYQKMFAIREQLEEGFRRLLANRGIPAQVTGIGSLFYISFTSMPAFRDYRDALNRDTASYGRFLNALADHGVRSTSRGIWFVSAAHTQEDVARTLQAAEEALSSL